MNGISRWVVGVDTAAACVAAVASRFVALVNVFADLDDAPPRRSVGRRLLDSYVRLTILVPFSLIRGTFTRFLAFTLVGCISGRTISALLKRLSSDHEPAMKY